MDLSRIYLAVLLTRLGTCRKKQKTDKSGLKWALLLI